MSSSAKSGSAAVNRTWNGPSATRLIPISNWLPRTTRASGSTARNGQPRRSNKTMSTASGRHAIRSPWLAFLAWPTSSGRQLHETLQVPVGLVKSAWGCTPAEAWTSHDHLAAKADLQRIQATWAERMANYDLIRLDSSSTLRWPVGKIRLPKRAPLAVNRRDDLNWCRSQRAIRIIPACSTTAC